LPNSGLAAFVGSLALRISSFDKRAISEIKQFADVTPCRLTPTSHQSNLLEAHIAIFITFDEGGGYYDSGYIQPVDFFGDGTRIPPLIVSPYSTGGNVTHGYGDHVSIDKFIERNWSISTITSRSRDNFPNPITANGSPYVPANSPALDDLFEAFNFSPQQPDTKTMSASLLGHGRQGQHPADYPVWRAKPEAELKSCRSGQKVGSGTLVTSNVRCVWREPILPVIALRKCPEFPFGDAPNRSETPGPAKHALMEKPLSWKFCRG
jgi:Phosphoesterase family